MNQGYSSNGRALSRLIAVLFVGGAALFLLALLAFNGKNGVLSVRNVAFQNGDLVFIRGRTWRSWIVRFFDVTDDFSHVGIVRFVNGDPVVIHATPEAETVQLESVEVFLSPSNANHAAVYRLKDGRFIAETASFEALGYFERGISFDHSFDILRSDRLYCTELVWRAYKHAGVDLGDEEANFFYDAAIYGKVLLPVRLSRSRRLVRVEEGVDLILRDH